MPFTFKLSKRLAVIRRPITTACVALLLTACEAEQLTNPAPTLLPTGATPAPSPVTGLSITGTTDSSITLRFVEVNGGGGQPASYDIRYAQGTLTWGQASPVSRGSCTSPLAGTAIGATRTCTVNGLAAATAYQFQLVPFRGTINLNASFGPLSNVASASTGARTTYATVVTDLAATATTETSLTISFTEIDGGNGAPASYDLRFSNGPFTWGLASSVTSGTCATPVTGVDRGALRTCTITGLSAGTTYGVQLISFRGTLNVDAVFGQFSNLISATTAEAEPVASVTVSPGSASAVIGATTQLTAVLRDAGGRTLSGRTVVWSSSDTDVATVSSSGIVTARAPGSATITATSEGRSGTGAMSVLGPTSPPPADWENEPAGMTLITDTPFDALDTGGWNTAWNSENWVHPAIDADRGNVLRWEFPANFTGGGSPGVVYYTHAPARDVYSGFYWKVSDPWQTHPSQVNKIVFWATQTHGSSLDIQMYGPPPYSLDVVTQFNGNAFRLRPNMTQLPVTLGVWHKIEWHVRYASTSSSADGLVEWWMDGVLLGRYNDVQTPDDPGFIEYQFSPTWGGIDGVKTQNDWYLYDEVRLSRR